MEQGSRTGHIRTISQLTALIKNQLETTFPEIWVEGEISNLSIPQSGHAYFSLKDEHAQIRAVLFRSSQRFLKFTLQHGMQVVCRGRLGVYEQRGEYQLILEYVEPKGVGALQLAFEQLKQKLEREGLFDRDHKKGLPILPRRIGLITSPTGAAIRDMLRVIKRRHPRVHIMLYPVPVQGADAPAALCEALEYFNREQNIDVVIMGRGGGSLEDLWAFNDEAVARAVYASAVPVISAVGHETDYTIVDFVADLRAPTPSAAAEMVVKTEESFRDFIRTRESRIIQHMKHRVEQLQSRLRESLRVLGDPRRRLEQTAQRMDELSRRMAATLSHRLHRERDRLTAATTGLDHLNPLAILSRGYSISRSEPSGELLKDSTQARSGELIRTTLHRGSLISRIEKVVTDKK